MSSIILNIPFSQVSSEHPQFIILPFITHLEIAREQLLMQFFNFPSIYHVISKIHGFLKYKQVYDWKWKAQPPHPCFLTTVTESQTSLGGCLLCEGGSLYLNIRAIIRSHCLSQRGQFLSSFVLVPALFSVVVAGVIQCIILTRESKDPV